MAELFTAPVKNAALQEWLETISGKDVKSIEKVSGGGFRISSRVTFADPEAPGLFLKTDTGSAPKTPFNLKREYQVLAALDGRVLAPRTLGYNDALATMAMEHLPGLADYSLVEEENRSKVEKALVGALADVHALDISTLHLSHLPAGLTITEAMHADLSAWQTLLGEAVPTPHPIILLAFAWLKARLPQDNRPSAFVNGDAGQGNFLYENGRLTGLLDWEVAHVGHPLEDIGCLLARSLVQPPFAPPERIMALYREASGVNWTWPELLYATVLVMARFSVPISMSLVARDPRMDFGLTMGYFHLSLISILRLIAQAEGIALDESAAATGPVPAASFEYAYLAYLLSEIVAPEIDDPYVKYRLSAGIGLIGYLEAREGAAPPPQTAPLFSSVDAATHLVEEEGSTLQQTMQQLMHEALFREQLMQSLMGPLYRRRIMLPDKS